MKILIIRLSSIGDIVLTSPVVRCLKDQLSDSEIHYLTKEEYISLLENVPYVDKVITYNPKRRQMLRSLRAEHYDYVVDLQKNVRSLWLRQHLWVPSASFPKENIHKALYVLTKHPPKPIRHIAERYFDAARHFKIHNDGQGLDYFCNEESLPNKLSVDEKPYVALICGAKHETKNIPLDYLQYLACTITSCVVLLGGKEDSKRIKNSNIKFGQENIINLCGQTSLNQSALILKKAALVITPDTGMMHIASAFHRPMIVIWGNTTPLFGFAPYNTTAANCEVNDLKCRPCSKLGHTHCPHGNFDCMRKQKWQEIAKTADHIVETASKINTSTQI